MAKQKKTKKVRPMRSNAFLRKLTGPATPADRRKRARRVRKAQRATSYWQAHGPLLFSKVLLMESDRLLVESLFPDHELVYRAVPNAHLFPRYRSGEWDGNAYFISFADKKVASKFRSVFWNRDI